MTLTEINEITKARHEAKNLEYEKVLKYRLLIAYKEFKDVFF